MKKYLWVFFILIIVVGIVFFLFNKDDDNNQYGYTAERTRINDEIKEENNITNILNEINNNKKEELIAEFVTRLPNDTEARDDNIKLACKTLNGTIVKQGQSFSLWDILGCPTEEKGYEKAKSFTSNGQVIQSYGGGLCQLSTTIYNAVLKVNGLNVTERHEHSREVPYIEDGKDAAVSYGNSDLKFENNLEYDVKIEAKVENRQVKVILIRIS